MPFTSLLNNLNAKSHQTESVKSHKPPVALGIDVAKDEKLPKPIELTDEQLGEILGTSFQTADRDFLRTGQQGGATCAAVMTW
jgi:hypothetical protein